MNSEVRVCKYDYQPKLRDGDMVLDTTSRSKDMGRAFSPFLLGPVEVDLGEWGIHASETVENAWQYSKVYAGQTNLMNEPSKEVWLPWALEGFADKRAVRYPMGKGARPLYSWHKDQMLLYVEARKQIYVPSYVRSLQHSDEYLWLKAAVDTGIFRRLWLRDFDGWDHVSGHLTFNEVLNEERYKMGHAFVLWALLTEEIKFSEFIRTRPSLQDEG